uniref:FBD-associated F-box protein At3g52670 isoform X1 n=1 Tax=Nicotiana tabacum TaxID=4097 RepID=A0A1S3YMB9_TOBAC|nr:PREDICTED: FBD-associated F-box protein At3g52670-like isoform X1 [Nicotiana tabacum]XP_016453075.1 PREDICTED: FBD-associated F-box protein At3g52670-like isoform X1 [Nicotiana tabacum]XP_016453076.1 PREDICTED: FBD-associated F-box protein At3g52670-like isoform X1 [Nicotiana tabacum]XP_016453077.1 PREDICTED: FBD-associated F-box protein At3g52670-like isoform X1 [Nicotiana tabacum]XP_016453078.1 PREDICTED: FBD-associated F-box protein At3g52670-like isoform X1 [Nicotiana tabacum]XP_0164530
MARVTADILPECLIQKILSYCSFKRAAKMSILSKTWLQAWLTLPNLKFRARYYKDVEITDTILERYRDNNIPIDTFEFLNCLESYSREVFFPPIGKWLDIALQNGVKDIVYEDPRRLVRSYPLPIFKILAAKSLRELVMEGCDLMLRGSLSGGVTNCISLRKLSLSYVRLDNNMLQTLLNSCPLIDTFILEYCPGLEKIELLNLQKIKSVSIKTRGNQRVKIQAPTLERLFCCGALEESPMLDVVEYQNLKSLELSGMNISDGFLQHLFSRSQSLESLILDNVCKGLERFKICGSQSLRILQIKDREDKVGEIDASNLVSLEYMGDQIPKLKIAKESSQLKRSHIRLDFWSGNNLNASWFRKLRIFLLSSISWSQVSLYFHKCNEINMKDLRLHHRVATPQVNVLNVYIKSRKGLPTFVDALLWSCHPRKLMLTSTVEMVTCFTDRLMYMKNSKPLYSQLKDVKAYKFDCKYEALTEKKKVYFLLDW